MAPAATSTVVDETVPPRGVDTPQLPAAIHAVKATRPPVRLQFRAVSRWQRGSGTNPMRRPGPAGVAE
jgi:hypothetical protein